MTIASAPFLKQSKIFIIDDHPLMRDGLKVRIEAEPDLLVCGEAADGPEALAQLENAGADLVIIDLRLKSTRGLELLRAIKAQHRQVRMLVVSAYDELLYGERAIRAGAQGFVNKQEVQDDIIQAIRTVLDGRRHLSQQMTQRLLCSAIDGDGRAILDDPRGSLSARELQVFRLIGEGNSTSDIARQLKLSVHTIESYRENIRNKLNLSSGSELMRRAVQWVLEQH